MFLRAFYFVYFITIALIVLKALSNIVFQKVTLKRKMEEFVRALCFAPIWPLSLFAKNGRKKLLKRLPNVWNVL